MPITRVTRLGTASNWVREVPGRKVFLRPVPESPPSGAGLALQLSPTHFFSRKASASFLHLSTSLMSWKPSLWESLELFLVGRISQEHDFRPEREACSLFSQTASFPPPPLREAAAHGMGVFVCICVGRAFGGKVTGSSLAAGGQGSR